MLKILFKEGVILLFAALGIMFPINAVAQEDSVIRNIFGIDNLIEHNNDGQTRISAGRSLRSVDELPVMVYIISREDIKRAGYITLCDVLKTVPGIRVSQPHSGEYGETFIQRGMLGNNYTKILLNGSDIRPSGPSGMPLGANIPVRDAERIEIIYGPASAGYGNDACGGVINVVTRSSAERSFGQADMVVGSGGYTYFNFNAGAKFGRGKHVAEYVLYGSRLQVQNLNIFSQSDVYSPWHYLEQNNTPYLYYDSDRNAVTVPVAEMNQDIFNQTKKSSAIAGYMANYSGTFEQAEINNIPQSAEQMGFDIRYRGLTLSYNHLYRADFSSLGLSTMLYNYSDPNAKIGENIDRYSLSGSWNMGKFSTNTLLYYLRYRLDENSYRYVNWSTYPQYTYGASDDLGAEENITYNLTKGLDIAAGVSFKYCGVLPLTNECKDRFPVSAYHMFANSVDYQDDLFGSFGINPFTYYNTGGYIQAVYDWKIFSFTLGARYDYNSIYGKSFNPRVALLGKITDKLSMRVSQGYAYKAPSPEQMYCCTAVDASVSGYSMISYHHVSSGELSPEKITSTEVGLRYYVSQKNYMELVFYTNKIKDPLLRAWILFDTTKYSGIGSASYRNLTRTYINEKNATTSLRGYQFAFVLRDLFAPFNVNVRGSYTLSMGHENVSNDNGGENSINRVDFIRQTPRHYGQLAFDFRFLKVFTLTAENIYCSEWARKYYLSLSEAKFNQEPSFYNLDLTLALKIGARLSLTFKTLNVFNAEYGGIDMKEMDVDLPYNTQLGRTYRMGICFDF